MIENKKKDNMNKKMMNKWIFGAALLLFAACTQDELTDGTDTLPEGKYPLEIASVSMSVEGSEQPWGAKSPQTRVAESTDGNSSVWATGDVFYAKPDGATAPGTFQIGDGGTVSTQTTTYWTKTTDNVTAWYPADGTISLANQSSELAYVLKATATNASCNNAVQLNFTHQLAKVRIVFTGGNASKVTDVKIESYTQCTNEKGTVKDGTSVEEITMRKTTLQDGTVCWEANVVPGYEIKNIKVNNNTQWTALSKSVVPVAGQLHTITVGVNPIEININGGGGNIEIDEGEYVLKGNGNQSTRPIVVNGNADITLDNVQLQTTGDVMTIKNGVSVTLNVKGTNNKFTSTNGAGIKIMDTTNSGQRGSITINGTNASSSKLKVTAASGAAVGFRMAGDENVTKYCGNIEINNITLEATGGNGSPAIGISAIETDAYDIQKTYGKISINGSTVNASSKGGAACIGTPSHNTTSPFSLGTISITNSTVTATAEGEQAACIGFGYTVRSEGGSKKVIQKIEFTNAILNLTTGASNKVGFGAGDQSRELTEGIWKDGSNVGATYWNP